MAEADPARELRVFGITQRQRRRTYINATSTIIAGDEVQRTAGDEVLTGEQQR